MVVDWPDTLKRKEPFIRAATSNPLIWVGQIVPSVFEDPADFSEGSVSPAVLFGAKHLTPRLRFTSKLSIRQKNNGKGFTVKSQNTQKISASNCSRAAKVCMKWSRSRWFCLQDSHMHIRHRLAAAGVSWRV